VKNYTANALPCTPGAKNYTANALPCTPGAKNYTANALPCTPGAKNYAATALPLHAGREKLHGDRAPLHAGREKLHGDDVFYRATSRRRSPRVRDAKFVVGFQRFARVGLHELVAGLVPQRADLSAFTSSRSSARRPFVVRASSSRVRLVQPLLDPLQDMRRGSGR
jgi:hypothetical protein